MTRNKSSFVLASALVVLMACSIAKSKNSGRNPDYLHRQVQMNSLLRTDAEKGDDLKRFLSFYNDSAISMPEYQPRLKGKKEIENFYKEIFERQHVKSFEKKIVEIITLDSTIVEIGTFTKKYVTPPVDTTIIQDGKYWNIWAINTDGNLILEGEAFGFYTPVKDISSLIVRVPGKQANEFRGASSRTVPFELRAYNALNEKYVHVRDGATRSEFYTSDAVIFPFADSTVSGIDKIRPYLTAYTSGGGIILDSVAVFTDRYKKLTDGYLEYFGFQVKWRTPGATGRTEGKGIRIWRRQADGALKMYREIGTHDHIE